MSILLALSHLSLGDCVASLPGALVLFCIAPSAFNALKGRNTSQYKDIVPGAKIGPFTVFDYVTGTLIVTSILLTFNYIIAFLNGAGVAENIVNGSILLSILVGLSIHFFKPRNIIRPFIPTPVVWGIASFSTRYHYHVNTTISLIYTVAVVVLSLTESVNTGETVKDKPTKRLGRRASFLTSQMAQGAYPKKSNVPPPTIQGVARLETLPTESELANYLNELLRNKAQYERLSSVVIIDPNGDVYWEPVLEFDVHDHIITRLVKDEAELMAYIKSLMFVSLPLDKPLWELHMVENETGHDAIIFSVHHALGDGISIFNLAADVFTDAEGNPLDVKPFERRADMTKTTKSFKVIVDRVLISIRSFFKVVLLPATPGDSLTALKDPYKPYKFQPDRQIVTMKKIPLSIIKDIKLKFGVTVNDVLTSVLAGAFDRYLRSQTGESDKNLQIRALMPLAFPRSVTDYFRNLWCFISVPLPISSKIKSPSERLLVAKETLEKLKDSPEAMVQITLQELVNKVFTVEGTGKLALDLMTKHTCVFTNVMGPTQQMYCLGKPILEIQPFIANVVSQISVVSYNNEISLNFVVDPNVVKQASKLPSFFSEELEELKKAAADMKRQY